MNTTDETNPELESFREQWRAEVRARRPATGSSQNNSGGDPSTGSTRAAGITEGPRKPPPPPTKKPVTQGHHDEDYVQPRAFDAPLHAAQGVSLETEKVLASSADEPVSALEHYEKAVETEAAGKLGDSLRLYRKAFRMDDAVDQSYKNKHFPKPASKLAAQGVPDSGHKTVTVAAAKAEQPQLMKELIASFAELAIMPAQPEVKGMSEPPCPIAALPEELLVHILRDVAVLDVADFVRLSQVCKRFAYLVATEDRIWRRVCLGFEFGFASMHYHWQRHVSWEPLTEEDLLREASELIEKEGDDAPLPLSLEERAQRHTEEGVASTLTFYRSLYSSSWQHMFRLRPRIRFNGCYISTVNYMRSGQANTNQITWNSPVHIVTYYRYLRFFRDGGAISLLTTAEPADVVHHMTREAIALHSRGVAPHLPSIVMQSALRGRWRLAHAGDNPHASVSEVEGDVVVETEGVSKYIYRLDLALRSAGKGSGATRNNKLIWRGFYSYNRLTDDWAEFALKNDKPFFFSRVKSYGVKGE
ncbi:hypothetical protein B0T25DRAFT_490736 [Lasiosphaeria hispida]|uniref:F-box domain-containing protein n=1 Tax=Lasiosphaeria hispida TaxID=260671 RepID=A0AAJ0MJD8_9PEZI|nr:hypothetical protein B0T25DRAFT_490736 [Lasiosphaeria hispida]